jgi:endonuclease YncB( thermonuclease family)
MNLPARILCPSRFVHPVAFPWAALVHQGFTVQVVAVLDGDTIEVLHSQHPERIRLSGIDCPEKGQAYGNNAKQAASALVYGKEVILQTHGLDKYGCTLADVLLPDGTNVNHTLVKDGCCWWYRKYAAGVRCWKGWRRKHERGGKACGPIRSQCRRRSGGNNASSLSRQPVPCP